MLWRSGKAPFWHKHQHPLIAACSYDQHVHGPTPADQICIRSVCMHCISARRVLCADDDALTTCTQSILIDGESAREGSRCLPAMPQGLCGAVPTYVKAALDTHGKHLLCPWVHSN